MLDSQGCAVKRENTGLKSPKLRLDRQKILIDLLPSHRALLPPTYRLIPIESTWASLASSLLNRML